MVGLERGTVELEPHRPEWRREYETEVERIRGVTGDDGLAFEHVGSTAIPGIVAKPIIDVLVVVEDASHAARLVPVLEEHGYEYRPNDGVPDRTFLAKGPRANRTHYLSLTETGSDCYRESVLFRDFLREHPSVAAEYDRLKRELADEHGDDRPTYTRKKEPFIRRVLERASDERNP
ncbi:GrpB family protein [Haladaptatus sp. T7]|uniref:GrpB family protein n=1 Tax=Haladaptatus sp. T7 TaxID=2029368 RepID=UPI0021A25A89|nr:GrpB family protein [Haladaptatus sp. T7]GKZ12222.1 hypothetical protein HAL_01030 [Haladaptatus sp. T7]